MLSIVSEDGLIIAGQPPQCQPANSRALLVNIKGEDRISRNDNDAAYWDSPKMDGQPEIWETGLRSQWERPITITRVTDHGVI